MTYNIIKTSGKCELDRNSIFFQLNEKRRVLPLGFPWRQPYITFSGQPATAYIIMVDVNVALYFSCERLNTNNVSSKQLIFL